MTNKKRIGAIILTLLLGINIALFSSCKINKENTFTIIEKEGYTYSYYENKGYCCLIGDKKENNPKIWIVEPYLDGIEIRYFGDINGRAWMASSGIVPSMQNIEELYLPYNMQFLNWLAETNRSDTGIVSIPQKVILVNNMEDTIQADNGFSLFGFSVWKKPLREVYLTPIGYEYRIKEMLNKGGHWKREEYPSGEYFFYREDGHYINWFVKICKANTSYMFNYENSPNEDYFFIKDYKYGEKIETVPYEPIREGYTFDGWYKEPECINVWDFETDTLPTTLYNESNEEVYQETKLYAKWIEK